MNLMPNIKATARDLINDFDDMDATTQIIFNKRSIYSLGADANTRFFPQSDNELLLRPFECDEVKAALFSMFPDKAPGPDGMNPGFYQHYWDVVGADVSEFVVNCLSTCCLNDTNIVLIPKKSIPESVSDLCPIALCNVIYKIMAKVLANKLKHLLDGLISESQSAFIPNRLIADNILEAVEVGHFLHRKQSGMVGWGALKLDMAKAYDRMEWPFLRSMMLAMGFAVEWVDLVMLCVTTVNYNFLVNGVSSGWVVPSRGLRQGDPLSPYLFIICAEGLSLLLQKAQEEGSIHGCRVARGAPPISHLFFADDSLLFFKASTQEAGAIKHCLDVYESMSGQAVNYHKSSICFSRNTSEGVRDEVAGMLGVAQAPNFGKYLGLPNFVGRNRRAAFAYIEDKIQQRVCSWNKKLLSQAGKEVLLKSVAQAMPTFSMSVFLLPESVCLSIERTMNKYWWGSGAEKGIHWKAWDHLCVPKKFGGLGFKELRAFNLAMLGKQAWRFLTMPQSLVARVYKARYYPRTSFFNASLGNCPSYCWRSIMAAQDLVCGGIRRRIGNGKSTLIWGHPWLPSETASTIVTPMPPQLGGSLVSGLIDEETNTWDHSILTDIFLPPDVDRILRIPSLRTMRSHGFGTVIQGVAIQSRVVTRKARNNALWNGFLPVPRSLVATTAATLQAWSVVHHGQQANGQSVQAPAQTDQVLADTLLMCYFDASYDPVTLRTTFGAVLVEPGGESAIDSFLVCQISLVPRSVNFIAHSLAVAAVHQTSILYWDSVPPVSILAHFQPDTEDNVIHSEIVADIKFELDKHNVLVKLFRMAKAQIDNNPRLEVQIVRYISPCEASWHLFAFEIQHKAHSVERLRFHLPDQQSVVFADDDAMEDLIQHPSVAHSMFVEWFEANKK
ncbi:uncharacterized protein LOC115999336 [Ipomoea triloba]|uniref:uncharacterized protein LOC115999336 n=1 Tax=Ipomoea triloba TaxID=35885 RepID=UPI00125D7F1E|nr:uncharacterized protein LOC115999336 [Ipomoea triloba]